MELEQGQNDSIAKKIEVVQDLKAIEFEAKKLKNL